MACPNCNENHHDGDGRGGQRGGPAVRRFTIRGVGCPTRDRRRSSYFVPLGQADEPTTVL